MQETRGRKCRAAVVVVAIVFVVDAVVQRTLDVHLGWWWRWWRRRLHGRSVVQLERVRDYLVDRPVRGRPGMETTLTLCFILACVFSGATGQQVFVRSVGL